MKRKIDMSGSGRMERRNEKKTDGGTDEHTSSKINGWKDRFLCRISSMNPAQLEGRL